MVQGIARAGHQVKLRLRTKGDHIRHFIGNFRISLTGDLDHAGGKIHPRRLNAAVLQNFTQNSRAAAQVHAVLWLELMAFHPLKQLLTKNLRIIIPAEFIINLAKHIAVHKITFSPL